MIVDYYSSVCVHILIVLIDGNCYYYLLFI